MANPKTLSPNAWKTISVKCKIQNNDLQKALAEYDKLEEEEHDDLLECIAEIKQLALTLKKSREAAANKELAKYVAELIAAAEAEHKDVCKDKAQAEKDDKKAETESKKKEAEKGDEGEEEEDEEEEEEGAYKDKLDAALKKLKGAKGVIYQFIVCDAKPHPAIMLAKRISPKHKDELAKVTGSKRFLHVGECRFENSHYVFDMEKPVSGLAKKLQDSLKHHTGKRHPIKVGTEAAGAEEGPEGQAAGAGAAVAAAAGQAAAGDAAKSPRDAASAA